MTNNIVASDIIPLVSNMVDVFNTSNIKNDEIVGKTNTVFDLYLMLFSSAFIKNLFIRILRIWRERLQVLNGRY